MKRVLTAVILIPIVVLALFRAPLWLFTLLVLGVALLAAKEYFDIAEKTGFRPMRGLSYLMFCLFLVAAIQMTEVGEMARTNFYAYSAIWVASSAATVCLLLWPYLLLALGMRRESLSQSLGDAAVSFLVLPYIGVSLASMVLVRSASDGALFLLYLMLLVWSGDIAAYYVGRAIGKHKLAPRISPGKTWEGAIASAFGAVLVAVLLFQLIRPIYFALKRLHLFPPTMARDSFAPSHISVPLVTVIVFAACVNVAAQLGDLVESMLKRGASVKDSGTLLPGHGGVLDRIDALLFALPIGSLFYFALLAKYFRGVPYVD